MLMIRGFCLPMMPFKGGSVTIGMCGWLYFSEERVPKMYDVVYVVDIGAKFYVVVWIL